MDEHTQFIRDQKHLENFANEALDEAVYFIQMRLGIKSGDFASHFFSDGEVQKKLLEYAEDEFYNRQII